jgi:hypothetical protein
VRHSRKHINQIFEYLCINIAYFSRFDSLVLHFFV